MKTNKGSILAYSLIVLAMMLVIAVALSASSIMGRKSAGSTEASVQSLQTADSGVQLATKIMKADPSKTINTAFGLPCNVIDGVAQVVGSIGTDNNYTLSFYSDANGSTKIADCSQPVSLIQNIKSIGTYKNTVRAVSVAVAATSDDRYMGNCWEDTGTYAVTCGRINKDTGEARFMYSSNITSVSFSSIGSSGNPFSANGSGNNYSLACSGLAPNAFGCCRVDNKTGKFSPCAEYSGGSWHNTTSGTDLVWPSF